MSGIDKIVKEIETDAEREADSIISEAKKAAEKSSIEAEKKYNSLMESAGERLDRKASEEEKKIQSQCEQVEKLKLLETKQKIIEGILVKAKSKLLLKDGKEYFDILLKLMDRQVQAEKGELILNQKDKAMIPADFMDAANAIATKHGGMLDLSQDTASIDGGFILRYGNIEINSSFDALFEENSEVLTDTVNRILW